MGSQRGSVQDHLLPRAWEMAEQLAKQAPPTVRYSRVVLTIQLKRRMQKGPGLRVGSRGLGRRGHHAPVTRA